MSWNILKKAITDVIKTNGNGEITGQNLQNTLVSTVNALGENASFAGFAYPSTMPGTPDGPVFFFATEPGIYANFEGIKVGENETAVLLNRYGQWEKYTLFTGGSNSIKDLGGIGDNAFTYLSNLNNLVTKIGDGAYIFDKPILYSWYSGSSANLAISLAAPSLITQFHFEYGGSIKVRYIQWSVSQGITQQITDWNDYAVTSSRAGFMTPSMLKILEGASGVMGGNAQVIEWSHTHNMNDYKDAGTYRIKGERTGNPLSDNLPIMNSGSGHTIEGILYILDSSLANGSGNSDDCTITQFLMLSNRVGGQEGDMYMRSAYGANKDNLTWKPWEKYQTNMEVGVVCDMKLLNPSNPTQVIGQQGMTSLTDNGIYSGVYIGPKAMIGTYTNEYIEFQDPTGIETFVMVVINNYAAASNARCVTQIKFAVTNGGVFSMEKRSTSPGNISYWSQWESAGGGSSLPITFDSNLGVKIDGTVCKTLLGTAVCIGGNVDEFGGGVPSIMIGTIGAKIRMGHSVSIGAEGNTKDSYRVSIGTTGHVLIGGKVVIGDNVNIDSGNDSDYGIDYGIELGTGDVEKRGIIKIGQNVRIPNNLKFSISDNILTITDRTNTWKLTAES